MVDRDGGRGGGGDRKSQKSSEERHREWTSGNICDEETDLRRKRCLLGNEEEFVWNVNSTV